MLVTVLTGAAVVMSACSPNGASTGSSSLPSARDGGTNAKPLSAGSLGHETVLKLFKGPDGSQPVASLIIDAKGNLFGTTAYGGRANAGVVFEFSHAGGAWKETVLHSFSGYKDGSNPGAKLAMDAAGNLYGTTTSGGKTTCPTSACGVVFELSPSGKRWKETVLHKFSGGASDGAFPDSGVTLDSGGNVYGTTEEGGNSNCGDGCGVVYKLKRGSGDNWKESVLYEFNGQGAAPQSTLIFDTQGNLYGTTYTGGYGYSDGSVFELMPSKSGPWNEKVLLALEAGFLNGGAFPTGDIVMDASGNIFGTMSQGGSPNGYSAGVVYELTAGTWKENVLFDFVGIQAGNRPLGGVTMDASGKLYGTTEFGGVTGCPDMNTGCGNAWSLTPGGVESTVALTPADGNHPASNLVRDAHGNLYGTTSQGGDPNTCVDNGGCGSVFEITK